MSHFCCVEHGRWLNQQGIVVCHHSKHVIRHLPNVCRPRPHLGKHRSIVYHHSMHVIQHVSLVCQHRPHLIKHWSLVCHYS